jgi:hypothetical protein
VAVRRGTLPVPAAAVSAAAAGECASVTRQRKTFERRKGCCTARGREP